MVRIEPPVRLLPSRSPVRGPVLPDAPRGAGRDLVEQLIDIGRRNAGGRWTAGDDLAGARAMHSTNRGVELRAALEGDYDWLEVDVRRIRGALVASHDPTPAPDALRMTDWIRIGAATQRGLKLDFKERDAIAPTLDLVAAAGVPDARVVINVPVEGRERVTLEQLRRIRRRFPRATINLSLGSGAYTAHQARRAVELARSVGGPIAFPLDLARVDERVVRAFKRGGAVAIWNDPRRTPVRDTGATRAQLRRWGVNGTIDLR